MSAAVTRATILKQRAKESTCLAEAGINGNLEAQPVVEATRLTNAELGATSEHGMTPLMRAACEGVAGTVQTLIDQGAEANAKRSDGFNALALAAFFGHSQIVWLLLENGADLAATGRSETSPEMWADARGFLDIGHVLREARARKKAEASSPRTAVSDGPARFPRPAEKEEFQQASRQSFRMEASVVDEASDSETKLPLGPAALVDESTESKSESTANIFSSEELKHARQRPSIERPLRAVRTLPEIEDPPRLVVPRFHAGSAFLARLTSSRKSLVALIITGLLVFSGIAAFLFPQIRKSLADGRTDAVSNTTNVPTEPINAVAESGTNASGMVEALSAPATEPTSVPASKEIEEIPADTTTEKPDAAATSVSRSGTRTRKVRVVSPSVEFKEQPVAEEQPKPAPISVETIRSRSVVSTPAGRASEVPSSQPSFGAISGKPKSKVIQWP